MRGSVYAYWWCLLLHVIIVLFCMGTDLQGDIIGDADKKKRVVAVLEINSETFNTSHATAITEKLLEISSTPFVTLYACVHSSQNLIHDTSLQDFLYSTSLPIQKFFFSARIFGSICSTELPSSLLSSADILLQVSACLPLQKLIYHNLSDPSVTTPDLSFLKIPAYLVPKLNRHLREKELEVDSANVPSRLEVASHVSSWLQNENEHDYEDDITQYVELGLKGNECSDNPEEQLPPPAATIDKHISGPCHLWWPLNHSEFFVLSSASPTSNSQEYRENIIFSCPNLEKPKRKKSRKSDNLIVVLEGFQASDTRTLMYLDQPHVVDTREVLSLSGTKIEKEAIELVAFYLLPPLGDENGISSKWIRISICNSKINDMSQCISSFTISRTIIYGDRWMSATRLKHHYSSISEAFHPMTSQIHSRDVFGHALNMFGLRQGTFVEVGVNKGHFAKLMLEQWKGVRYIMVDPWRVVSSNEYVDIANSPDQSVHDAVFMEALSNVASYGSRPAIIRNTSVEAASKILENTVDVVYIDALHHYNGVMQDIHAWWPKIKVGGILAGHDFMLESQGHTVFTVKPAVQEFVRHMGLVLFQTNDDYATWFVFKR